MADRTRIESDCVSSRKPELKFSRHHPYLSLHAKDSSGNDFLQQFPKVKKRLLVIVGNPESGKTAFMKRICHLWVQARKDKMIVFWWNFLQNDHNKVNSLHHLAALPQEVCTGGLPQKNAIELQRNGGQNVV